VVSIFYRLLVGLALAACAIPFLFEYRVDPDLWWHVKFGIDLVETGHLETAGRYSYVAEQMSWTNHEWLSEIIIGQAFMWGGDAGLVLLRNLLFVLILGGLAWTYMMRNSQILLVLLSYALPMPLLSMLITLRPQSFSCLLLVLYLLCIEAYRKGARWSLYFLPILMIIWVNLHGGFVLGLAFVMTALLSFYYGIGSPKPKNKRFLVLIMGLTLCATLVNPYHVEIYTYLFKELGADHGPILEWLPLPTKYVPAYLGVVLIPLFVTMISRRFERPYEIIFFVLLAIATLKYRRFFLFCSIFGMLTFLSAASNVWQRWSLNQRFRLVKFLGSTTALALFVVFALPHSYLEKTNQVETTRSYLSWLQRKYPTQAIEFLRKNYLGPNLAIFFNWGGYAILHLAPSYKVSIDGRNLTLYPKDYVTQYLEAYQAGDLKGFLGEYFVDVVLVESGGPMYEPLNLNPDWKQVHRDSVAAIFVPSQPRSLT
jgi:hypothetical protein